MPFSNLGSRVAAASVVNESCDCDLYLRRTISRTRRWTTNIPLMKKPEDVKWLNLASTYIYAPLSEPIAVDGCVLEAPTATCPRGERLETDDFVKIDSLAHDLRRLEDWPEN